MQYSSCINFFIFIYPIVGYIYQSTGSQGSHFREDKFHIGSTGSWCQCKSVPGQIQNDGREEVSVFYFCIILSCFPDNGAREDLETVYFVASLISQQWINTLGPPCWPDFSPIICEWSRDAQALWSCLLTCMPSFAPALGLFRVLLPVKVRLTVSTAVLPVHYQPVWHWMCVHFVCPLEAKCHSSKITFCPAFLPLQNEFRFSVWVSSV